MKKENSKKNKMAKEQKTQRITTTIVTLNNKSRKGLYIYVKVQGKRGAYYKLDNTTPINTYKKHYKNQYIKKEDNKTLKQRKKETKRIPQQLTKILRKTKTLPTIKRVLKAGISITTINNIHVATQNTITQKTQELLSKLIIDKQLIKVMSQESNMQKIKNRLEHTITITNNKGETLLTARRYNKTIKETIRELKKNIRRGTMIEEESPNYTQTILKDLKYEGINTHKEGRINKIGITTRILKNG